MKREFMRPLCRVFQSLCSSGHFCYPACYNSRYTLATLSLLQLRSPCHYTLAALSLLQLRSPCHYTLAALSLLQLPSPCHHTLPALPLPPRSSPPLLPPSCLASSTLSFR